MEIPSIPSDQQYRSSCARHRMEVLLHRYDCGLYASHDQPWCLGRCVHYRLSETEKSTEVVVDGTKVAITLIKRLYKNCTSRQV